MRRHTVRSIQMVAAAALALCGLGASAQGEGTGTISGRTLARGEPAAVKMNLHKRPHGQFFGSVTAGEDGRFVFDDLPLGEYTLITWPVKEMPLQWSSIGSVELKSDRPSVEVPALDCYSVKPLGPPDGTMIEPGNISRGSPLVFEWTAHGGRAEYTVEIRSIEDDQRHESPRLREPRFAFDGAFADGSKLKETLYRWTLTVYPEGGFWRGRSKFLDLAVGDTAQLVTLESPKHMELTVPKWYLPTARELELLGALDILYEIEFELSGAKPFDGKRYGVLYDPEITFAHSGNPLHLGKPMWQVGDFAWDILLHEMGHDFQTGALPNLHNTICAGCEGGPPFYIGFTEGLATLAGFYIDHKIADDPKLLPEKAVEGVVADVEGVKKRSRDAFAEFEKLGCPRDRLTPDVVDGFLLRLADEFGWQIFPSFFRGFAERPETARIFESADSDGKRQAIVVCAFSLACGVDLRERFARLGIEVEEEFYERSKEPLQIAIFGDRP